MLVRSFSFARAGLVGNPSDGYFGKTISFTFDRFRADVECWESPELELVPSRRDHSVFKDIRDLHADVQKHGYYGGFRLLKASCKAFLDYCRDQGIVLDSRNFTLRYRSNIPGRVGLAGSSAIVMSCVRALAAFYDVYMEKWEMANLALRVENDELGIPAGLQDRVVQAIGGMVYMDFNKELLDRRGYGEYEPLDAGPIWPALYIAYREDLSEGTEVYHNDLRSRYKRGDKPVLEAIQRWGSLAEETRAILLEPHGSSVSRRIERISVLLDENFDLRASLYDVGDGNRDLVRTARSFGASAKFAGSGGAIVGLLEDPVAFDRMVEAFAAKKVVCFRPNLVH